MKWNEKCLLELQHHNMFETTDHRNRFRDLVDCYYTASYFSKNLCKCMYLSCWNEIFFFEMMSMLNDLTIEGAKNTFEMSEQCRSFASRCEGTAHEMYKLIVSFLTNEMYDLPNFALMESEGAHMIRQSLLASKYIDDLPDVRSEEYAASSVSTPQHLI